MKHVKTFESFFDLLKLNEEKNYGDLYHSLRYFNSTKDSDFVFKNEDDLLNLVHNILTSGLRFEINKHKNSIYKHPKLFDYYISVTRDKSHTSNFLFSFVLDAQKISNNYRIVPFNKFVFADYIRNTNSRFKVGRFTSSNFPLTRKWSEEKIVSKKPGFLSNIYFKELIINNLSHEFEERLKELLSELNLNIKVNRIDSKVEKIKKLGT